MTWLRVAVLPVLVVLLLGVVVALPEHEQDASATSTPVTQTTYACAGAPVASTGQVSAGDDVRATVLGEEPTDAPDAADPGAWTRSRLGGPLVVTQDGEGSGAVGFASGALDAALGGGLVVDACPDVFDDAWFTGLGSGDGHTSRLLLTNLADTAAVVDVTVWGPEGRIDAVDASGVVVEPQTSLTLPLADLAAGEPDLAVRVERRRGAVAVAALDSVTTGGATGSELVTAVAGPARRQVLPGVPAGAAGRTLQVLNPTGSTVRVAVEAIGPEGTFVPEGLDEVRVGAGATERVQVPRSAGAGALALRLVADAPVVASVLSTAGGDRSTAEAAPRLSGPAVVPVGPGLGTPDLLLTVAGDDAAGVVLEARGRDLATLAEADVDLEAGLTTSVDLAEVLDLEGAAFVVVRPTGSVHGAAAYRTGDGTASLALQAAPVEVLAPRVRPLP